MEATNPRPSPDTAESLADEQASVNTEMEHVKLRRATEQINLLEGKLQQAVNENAKQIASQTEQAEEDKKLFKEMLGKNSKNVDEFNCLFRDFERDLICLKKEHGTMVAKIQQDNEHKESTLRDYHKEVLQRRSQVENELKEGLSLLRKEHELQIKSLRMYHEKECQSMQEKLELQKSKEDKERAWLQLQWKEMRESNQVDQEVNSKKILSTHQVWTPSDTYVVAMNTTIEEGPIPPRPQKDDDIWDKRQIMYVLVLTTTVGLVFLLQPLLPVTYGRWIIFVIAAFWGIGSIGLPVGLYGTSRHEKDFSRYTGRLIYTLFSSLVVYGFYLLVMHTGDTSASTLSPSLKEGTVDVNDDTWWTVCSCVIGSVVLIGNIWSSIRGCLTGGDKDP